MNQTPDPTGHAVAEAEGELARLGVQVDAMRALLVRLTQDAISAQRRLDLSQAAGLAEVNEHLVLAALTARELQTAAERARQRHTAFLAAVADELRNPMAPIRIASAMLGGLPADERLLPRVQAIVEQQLTQMSRLLGELVDASNVDTGGLALERRPVDMGHVIDAAVAACRPAMDERGQRFESHRPRGPLPALQARVSRLYAAQLPFDGSGVGRGIEHPAASARGFAAGTRC